MNVEGKKKISVYIWIKKRIDQCGFLVVFIASSRSSKILFDKEMSLIHHPSTVSRVYYVWISFSWSARIMHELPFGLFFHYAYAHECVVCKNPSKIDHWTTARPHEHRRKPLDTSSVYRNACQIEGIHWNWSSCFPYNIRQFLIQHYCCRNKHFLFFYFGKD